MQHPFLKSCLILLLPFLISCNNSIRESLDEADGIIGQSPARALELLQRIDTAFIDNDADRAFYGLLTVQAQVESGLPVASDSLISESAAYYNGMWPSQRQVRALYYQGVIMNATGHSSEAIIPLMRARNFALDLGDKAWAEKTSNAIDGIFSSASSRDEAVRLGQSATDVLTEYVASKQDVEIGRRNVLKIVILLLFISFCALIIVSGVLIRFRMKAKNDEIRSKIADLFVISSRLESECNRNKDSKAFIRQLFRERWSELNIMCNEYFELESTPNARLSLVRNIERELDKMRSPDNIRLIMDSVNNCMDGVIDELERRCPFLKPDDLAFLALLYAGFSPRAVCMFTGIKLKYFYNKRSRLLARISNHLGPDADKFIALLA